MKLAEHFETSGNWLFRWRSYLPLLLLGLSFFAMLHFEYPGNNHAYDLIWESAALAIALFGLGIRVVAVGCAPERTSGRNTREQVADTLNTTGIYSMVRHPLYLGNCLICFGVALFPRSLTLVIIVLLICWLYHERIVYAEEAFLERKFGDRFRSWAAATPAMWPQWFKWVKPALPFSWRNAVKREYHGFFGILSVFFVLEISGDWFARKQLIFDPVWVVLWLFGLLVYVTSRFLRKRTNLLNVVGR